MSVSIAGVGIGSSALNAYGRILDSPKVVFCSGVVLFEGHPSALQVHGTRRARLRSRHNQGRTDLLGDCADAGMLTGQLTSSRNENLTSPSELLFS